jgi:hypothetical protein
MVRECTPRGAERVERGGVLIAASEKKLKHGAHGEHREGRVKHEGHKAHKVEELLEWG